MRLSGWGVCSRPRSALAHTPAAPLPAHLSFMRLRRVSAASRTWASIMARARDRSATPSASRSAPLSP